jgi:flavin reductase (DIM6/NTAB) family NADH-FMN oxidoreductase RutF
MSSAATRTLLASELDPASTYKLLGGLVLPRPIAFISTLGADGVPNLAPFSFFTVASTEPPVLCFSIDLRYGHQVKDTMRNIEHNGEFVINVATEDLAQAVNTASLDWGPEVDEIAACGLTAAWDNAVVKAPRVAESPAQFECRFRQRVDFGQWTTVFGDVLAFHCRESLLDARMRVDIAGLRPLGRLSGNDYCRTGDRFTIERKADTPANPLAGGKP